MTSNEPKQKAPIVKLYPHQAAFLDMFFSTDCKRQILLKGGYGTGKTTVLNAVAQEFLKQRPSARVLFMAPEGLLPSFGERLRETNTPLQIIERYIFREMLDFKANGDFWPVGQVNLISHDFANKNDIQDSISNTIWDLVIIDEARAFRENLIQLFSNVSTKSNKVIVSSTVASEDDESFFERGITVVEWRHDMFANHELYGERYGAKIVPRPALHEVVYSLTLLELNIRDKVSDLFQIFKHTVPSQNLIAKLLLKSSQSSPAALEGILQKMVERPNNLESLASSPDLAGADLLEKTPIITDVSDIVKVQEIAANVIQENYDIDRDSKLDAFNGLLSRINEGSNFNARICVITEYVSTLYYLATEMENQGAKCILLHGRMTLSDRQRSISQFNKDGGLLITTVAPLQGFELSDASDLVFYDIPGNKEALWVVLSRFDRIGRAIQLNMHVFLPDNSANSVIDESLELLRKVVTEAYNSGQTVARLGQF